MNQELKELIYSAKLALTCIAKANVEKVYDNCVMPRIGEITYKRLSEAIEAMENEVHEYTEAEDDSGFVTCNSKGKII
jgi:hypothetical protein